MSCTLKEDSIDAATLSLYVRDIDRGDARTFAGAFSPQRTRRFADAGVCSLDARSRCTHFRAAMDAIYLSVGQTGSAGRFFGRDR